jgi:hypothetical protein
MDRDDQFKIMRATPRCRITRCGLVVTEYPPWVVVAPLHSTRDGVKRSRTSHHKEDVTNMQNQVEAEPWNAIKTQITGLRVFESQIEDLRSLLAEDWQIRLSRREVRAVAAVNCRYPSDAVRFDHASNPAFSAC